MAKKRQKDELISNIASSEPPEIPSWLNRVQMGLRSVPRDPARNIFLERAFEAVLQITRVLPTPSIEQTAAADNNVMVLLRALQSPEILPELERIDPLASPYMRGLEAQHDLLKRAGGTLSSEEMAAALKISRQAVDKRRQAGKLIAIPQGQHRYLYPACQLGERGGTLSGLEDLLGQLGDRDGWMQLSFLLTPNADLDAKCPLDLLRHGVTAPVMEAAARFGEQGAQ